MLRSWGIAGVAAAAVLWVAVAQGAAVTYSYTSGSATVTATAGGTTIGMGTLTLNGQSAAFDSTTGDLTGFSFTTTPNQWIVLNQVFGGFDQVWVNNATMSPAAGYATLFTTETSPGHWDTSVMPVMVQASYTGKNSMTNMSEGPFPLTYTNVTPLNSTIDLIGGTFTLQGITLAELTVANEPNLIIKADVTFQGARPVPEPAAAGVVVLAGLALGLLLWKRE